MRHREGKDVIIFNSVQSGVGLGFYGSNYQLISELLGLYNMLEQT